MNPKSRNPILSLAGIIALATLSAYAAGAGQSQIKRTGSGSAAGPLRVHPTNSRYFTDDGQRAVYLTGAHTWDNLQDMGEVDPPAAFDFDAYLDFLAQHDHNFIRLWRWELVSWDTSANDKKTAKHLSKWGPVRRAMGVTRRLAERVNLAAMTPRSDLASSGYCLANPAKEYLVYLSTGGDVSVNLAGAAGEFQVEWIHPIEGKTIAAPAVSGRARMILKAPQTNGTVLHLWRN